jgi:hypothetical protein
MPLTELALAAMKERDEKNRRYNEERTAQDRDNLLKYALAGWGTLGLTVEPTAIRIDEGFAFTTVDGVKLAYRYSVANHGHRFYVGMPCPRRDETDADVEHNEVLVEFQNLADLGDALTTIPTQNCWKCQERAEAERESVQENAAPARSARASLAEQLHDVVRQIAEVVVEERTGA